MSLNEDACKALKAMGYPQDKAPQFVYVKYYSDPDLPALKQYHYEDLSASPFFSECTACPDSEDAIDWLEDELRFYFERSVRPSWSVWYEGREIIHDVTLSLSHVIIRIHKFLSETS